MMAEYFDDLFLRAYLGDVGTIPASDPLYTSPDIIPWGPEPAGDPKNLFANFSVDLNQPMAWNIRNYIYSRATNLSSSASQGQLHLYWTKATLINYPFVWKDNKIPTQSGADFVPYQAPHVRQQVIGAEPFVFTPNMTVKPNDHICIVSQMVTGKYPNNIPLASNVGDFAAFLRNHRNFAWRNVLVRNLPQAGGHDWDIPVAYAQGDATAPIVLTLKVWNLPLGSIVSATCKTNPALAIPPFRITYPNQAAGVVTIPIAANFSGTIDILVDFSGQQPPVRNSATSVTLDADYLPSSRTEADSLGALPLHIGRLANYHLDVTGLDPNQPVAAVGSYEVYTPFTL
jgi:hypothetical protein